MRWHPLKPDNFGNAQSATQDWAVFVTFFGRLYWYKFPVKSYFDYRIEEDGYHWYVTSNFVSKYLSDIALRNSLVLSYLDKYARIDKGLLAVLGRIMPKLTRSGRTAVIAYWWFNWCYRIYFPYFSWLPQELEAMWMADIDINGLHMVWLDLLGSSVTSIKIYRYAKYDDFSHLLWRRVSTEFTLHMCEYRINEPLPCRQKVYFCFDTPVSVTSAQELSIFERTTKKLCETEYNIDFLAIDLSTKKSAIYIETPPYFHFAS